MKKAQVDVIEHFALHAEMVVMPGTYWIIFPVASDSKSEKIILSLLLRFLDYFELVFDCRSSPCNYFYPLLPRSPRELDRFGLNCGSQIPSSYRLDFNYDHKSGQFSKVLKDYFEPLHKTYKPQIQFCKSNP